MPDAFLRTEDMAVGYDGHALIEHICLTLQKGEILTLIGPNGAGKSTILKSIIRQLRLLGGAVYLDGRPMAQMDAMSVARKMSILMTERVRPELMTCWDVVSTGRYPYTGRLGLLSAEDRRQTDQALRLVHAEALACRSFAELSDGQRQRILLARAICQQPEVIVLDEPTSFLDIRYKLELLEILKDMVRARGLAVILSMHELDLAQRISDRVACVSGSAIERCGPPEEIFTADYITRLYGAQRGSYNADFGCLELARVSGAPEVFVIGGGGGGIPVYRRLQRQGVPFAAGVLHQNDLDYPVAAALAAEVVAEAPFAPVSDAAFDRAAACMSRCRRVICCAAAFGPMNERNRALAALAQQNGWLEEDAALPDGRFS